MNITFIFGRCRRSPAAVASTKYEYNWKIRTGSFCKIEKFAYGETDELSFSNPTPSLMSTYDVNWSQSVNNDLISTLAN